MYCTKLMKRALYHVKMSKEMFVMVLLYIIIFELSYVFWPLQWDFEFFSILNQLLFPLVGCIWINGCVREWIESEQKETLFFYSGNFCVRQLCDILIFQFLLIIAYLVPFYNGYVQLEDVLVEIVVCITFQTLYCLGLLLTNSSTLVLFAIVAIEVVNAMAYLKNLGYAWYLFLKPETMSGQQLCEKYVYFVGFSIILWIVYFIVFGYKKRRGTIWS